MSGARQLECRVVITNKGGASAPFELGMYDPLSGRYEPLGTHPANGKDKIVRDLKVRMEREGHLVSFSEQSGPR